MTILPFRKVEGIVFYEPFQGAFGNMVLRNPLVFSLGFNEKAGQQVLVTNLPKHNDFHTVDNKSCKHPHSPILMLVD